MTKAKKVVRHCYNCAYMSDGERFSKAKYECPECGKAICQNCFDELIDEECDECEPPVFEKIGRQA